MNEPIRYKYIFWDWNGTIFNDLDFCVAIMNEILTDRKLPFLSVEKYREVFDFPVKSYYQKLGFDFDKESFEKVGTAFMDKYNNRHLRCKLHKGIKKTLSWMREFGFIQFVLSAREENELVQDLKHYGIYENFKDVVGLNNHYAHGKTEIGKQLIKKYNINPKECVLIGDTVHDAAVAKSLNLDCLLIPKGHNAHKKLKQCNVPIFEDLKELKKHLLRQS